MKTVLRRLVSGLFCPYCNVIVPVIRFELRLVQALGLIYRYILFRLRAADLNTVFETDSTYKVWRDAALGSSTHPTTKLKSKPMQATHPSILPKRTRSNGPPKQPIPGLVKAHLRPKQTAPRDKGLETIMSDHSLPAISLLSSEDVAPHQDDDTPNSHQRDSTPLWSSTNSDDYPPEIGESPQPADWPDTDSLTRSPKCFGALQDDVPFRSNGFELSDIPTPVRRREITPISQLDLEEWQEEDWEICSLSSPSRSESDPELILVGGTNNPEVKIERGLSLAAQYEAEHPEDKPWDGNWRTWPRCLNVGEWGAHLGPWSFEYDEERTARAGGIQWTVLCDCCGGLYLVSDSNAGTIWPEVSDTF